MKYTVFYSWQMKTDTKKNKNYIKDCIEKACKKIEQKPKPELKGISFELQEGRSGISGTPQIARTIMDERIPNCDIFIADLTVTDPLNKLTRFYPKKWKRDVHQANNVMFEYGNAYKSVGEKRIICVLNSENGSPNENPENIPFDIRHMSFPIQYKYNIDKEAFINTLKEAISSCSITAIQERRNKFKPFQTWNEFGEKESNKSIFFENDIITSIKKYLIENKSDIRFLGLSGLGKTRITFEAFRSIDDNISLNYLYCEYQPNDESSIQSSLEKLFSDKTNTQSLVIDNCPLKFFRKMLKMKFEFGVTNPIISLFNEPEEKTIDKITAVEYIQISISDLGSVVDQILETSFTYLTEDQRKIIKEFSEGIPLMATLLAENARKEAQNIGLLTDKALLDKLLSMSDEREKEILKSCSIFRYIGFEEEAIGQIEFIITCKEITQIPGNDEEKLYFFNRTFNKYHKREIFEKNGRLFGIRPRPLAFSLATEWFETCTSDRLKKVIEAIQSPENPHSKILTESLSKQIKYLGNNEKVKELIDKLTGPNGPFDNAEVANTELGSRLFRSFVEVNPVAVAKNLYRLFSSMTIEQLKLVNDGRRNLVWSLEKLCFDKETFEIGAKLMMSFAVAENETWGNNSTNEFLHLFKIHLAGTQAKLNDRLEIIKWGLTKGEEYSPISLKALSSALESQHFTRVLGAELQGTKKLEDYIPSNNEIIKYWTNVLDILEKYIGNEFEDSTFNREIITNNTRGLIRAGVANIILPVIKRIAEGCKYDWDLMLDTLYNVREYDLQYVKPEFQTDIDNLIQSLTKKDFYSRFARVEKNGNRTSLKIDFQESIKLRQKEYYELANEFVTKEFCSKDILVSIYKNKHHFTAPFGARIAELIEKENIKLKQFVEISLDILSSIEFEKRNSSIIIDFASGIKLDINKDYLIDSLLKRMELSYLLFPIFGIFKKDYDDLEILFSLVENGIVSIDEFTQFFNYYPLKGYSESKLVEFSRKIKEYGIEGVNTVLTLLHNLLYFNNELSTDSDLFNLLEDTLISIEITKLNGIRKDEYFQMINVLLTRTNSKTFAKIINLQVIKLTKDSSFSYSYDYHLEKLYDVLITKYFDEIWEDLSEALLSDGEDYFVYYHLKHLLGSQIGGVSNQVGILFLGNIERIFDWCKKYPEKASARLASMVPIFEEEGFHSITKRLIDEFGENHKVLDNLGANMGSYSWVGSTIPLLKSKRKLLESLITHPKIIVKEWSEKKIINLDQEILREIQREEEQKFLYS
jgi:hypothetical protein